MKSTTHSQFQAQPRRQGRSLNVLAGTFLALLCFAPTAFAANDTWNGGGADGKWQTPGNWGGTPPASGDALTFQGTVRLNNTNNFSANTVFNGITFNNPAGAFNLFGSQITLANDIVDNQVVVNQSVNLPLSLDATHNLNVITDGLLTINGAISGAAGAGITLPGGGRVTLTATNTFTGPVTINNGTLFVSSDRNLGAVPAAPTLGAIVINGGTLRTGTSFTNNMNRGIRLGPVGGSGSGTIQIDNPATLTYSGVIADNTGGTGGLTKLGFGGLTLAGTNTYSGPTLDEVGTITLDFTQTNAPGTNTINPVSSLTLGGANAGFGAVNFAALVMNGKTNTASKQTFNGTLVTFGGSVIQARSLGANGAANLNLGLLTHNPGGTLVVVPPVLTGGQGNVTTTATNVNGILGGFATVSDGTTVLGIVIGTNFACVDASGNITNYNGYQSLASSQNIHSISTAGTNVLISSAVTGDMVVDDDNANSVTDVNAINWKRTDNLVTLKIGIGNTLRLGRYGSIFKPNTTAGLTWLIGETAAGGNGADQNVGTLTAGGATNTPGEIVLNVNNTSSSSGTVIIDSQIADNGTGAVTFVKAGVGSMKLRGHNTYSGGTYLLQGRVQLVGGEGGVGSGNADACGTGPIYVLPGAYLFPSGTGPTNADGTVWPVTNAVFIAGNGTAGEPLGAIRGTSGWLFNGPWTLIGDTTLGGNGGASGAIGAKLSGAFNLGLCSPATVNGTVCLTNSANDWSGTTTLNARSNTGGNTFLSGNSEIIPNGFGKGNVVMNGFSTGTIAWNLNGFNETINGLITSGTASTCSIINSLASSASTLTLGDNDQSGAFGGAIQDGTGTVALTKIGDGIETLSGTVTYSGNTTVIGGTLALISISGALSSSAVQVNSGAVLDVSGVSGGNVGSSTGIGINGGRLIANASGSSINNLSVTNADLQVVLNPATVNIQGVTTLTTGGTTNLLDISSIQNVAAYPAQFTVIKYTGSIAGSGFNFGLGTVPTATITGYVSNNVANSSVDIVLFNGPKLLNWTASVNTNWDITGTANWKFGAAPVVYNDLDSPNFDDTASSGLVYLTTTVTPGGLTVSNNALNYVFTGSGNITGFGGLTKLGTGAMTITNTGVDNYSGGVVISGGGKLTIGTSNNISGGIAINSSTLQITAGNLPSGNLINEGTLLFNATSDISANNSISGDSLGVIIKTNTDTVTLGGASTHNGTIIVAQGTLKAGSGGAFGNGSTVIVTNNVTTSATLDVNGQTLQTATIGATTFVVNGAGVDGNGAIVNSGASSINALVNVTLAGDTTFGGNARWDIRSITTATAQLQTGGQAFNLTKVGTNIIALNGVYVDGSLSNIFVLQGELGIEAGTSGNLGDTTTSTLNVAAGALIELFNNTAALSKPLVLNGNGVNNTVLNSSGANHISSQTIVLNSGNSVFNVGGTSLSIDDNGNGNTLNGTGGLTKSGGSLLYINIPLTYSGLTVVSNGYLVVDAPETNSSSITVSGGTLAGTGWFASPVTVGPNGTLSPGDTNSTGVFTLVISNSLSLAGTVALDVTKNGDATFTGDLITNVTSLALGGTLRLNLDTNASPMQVGDIIKLFSFNSASGSFASIVPATPGEGLAWDQGHLTTDGTLRVIVASAIPPFIGGIILTSGNIVISGNGVPNGNYVVLATTNVALPLIQWTPIATNTFDGSGNFSFTNPVDPNSLQRFYILSQ